MVTARYFFPCSSACAFTASSECVRTRHRALVPEREEVRQIFGLKGFSGGELERIADVITDDGGRRIWPFSNRKIASRLVIHFCNRSIRRRFCPTVRVGDLGFGGGTDDGPRDS